MEKMKTKLRTNDIASIFDYFILGTFNGHYCDRVCAIRAVYSSRGWKHDTHKTIHKIEEKLTKT
jgi:hypothetical protein